MKEFLLNILPRIKAYSKELDVIENIIDKPWIWISDTGENQKLIFRREGVLLMVKNGEVKTGSWEYINSIDSFLIDRNIDKLLMNRQFQNDFVMLLKRDGSTANEIFPFVNELNIPTLNYKEYLSNLATITPSVKLISDTVDLEAKQHFTLLSLDKKVNSVYSRNLRFGVEPSLNEIIETDSGTLLNGYYVITHEAYDTIPKPKRSGQKVYNIKNGFLMEEFYFHCLKTKYNGRPIHVYHKNLSIFQTDLMDSAVLYADTFEEVQDLKFSYAPMSALTIRNGRVIKESLF